MEVFIAKSGHETGPFSADQIKPMLESGMLNLSDSVWHQELTEWIPVHQFLGLRPPLPSPTLEQNCFGDKTRISPLDRGLGKIAGFLKLAGMTQTQTLRSMTTKKKVWLAGILTVTPLCIWLMTDFFGGSIVGKWDPVGTSGIPSYTHEWLYNPDGSRDRVLTRQKPEPWWSALGNDESMHMELVEDGTFLLAGETRSFSGTYKLLSNDRLKVEFQRGASGVMILNIAIERGKIWIRNSSNSSILGGYVRSNQS